MNSIATLHNHFDIQVDSNHTWDEPNRTVQIEVFPLGITAEGLNETDGITTLAFVEIPNGTDVCEDMWYDSTDTEALPKLPQTWQDAVRSAVETAKETQGPLGPMRYAYGQTVFLTEHRFPGDVEDFTTDGRYVVEMANSGIRDVFTEAEMEPYDANRWEDGEDWNA